MTVPQPARRPLLQRQRGVLRKQHMLEEPAPLVRSILGT